MLQESLQYNIPGGVNYCNVIIGAVLPWKTRIFGLELQVFSLCCAGIHWCNVAPFLYRILFWQNRICNNFVSNGKYKAFRDCSGNGWGSDLLMCCLSLRQNGKHINKIPRKSHENAGQSRQLPGTISWNVCLPFAMKTLPTRKQIFLNYFPITVSRFRFFWINFKKLPDTYCTCVSCVSLPGWDPCPCRIIFFTVTRSEFFRINWVMFSDFWAIFPISGRFFPYFQVRPKSIFRRFFFRFRAGGPKSAFSQAHILASLCVFLFAGIFLAPAKLQRGTIASKDIFDIAREHPWRG